MRSRERGRPSRVGALLVILSLAGSPVTVADPQTSGGLPTEAEVERAVAQVAADPNLAREGKTKTLAWRRTDQQASDIPDWLGDLFGWLLQSLRLVVWIAVAILVAVLAVLVVRQVRDIRRTPRWSAPQFPTHVRDLDIRPESLPDDIGAAALELWERGERRAALALLYRGLLSRLVHLHAVPIKASSTEGDCLALAREHLPEPRQPYAVRLVRVWQRAVYGAHEVSPEEMRALCEHFERELGHPGVARG